MSVISSDLVIYGAANIAEADGVTHGGVIDTEVRYVFTNAPMANTLNENVDIVSDQSGDTTQTVTITGRNSEGAIITEDLSLNGVTPVTGSTAFERLLKVVSDAAHDGTITVTSQTSSSGLCTLESGVLSVRRPFYNVSSDVAGGSARAFYEKIFIKNNNSTNALLNSVVSEAADPSTNITFDLEDACNDNNTVSTRIDEAPSGMLGSFDNANKNVPGVHLGPGSGIGCWMKLSLAAGEAADKSTWTVQIQGSTA
jgi:hypothetical protein